MNTELYAQSITTLGTLMRQGKITPVMLLEACLDRIDAYDACLQSFVRLNEQVLQQAHDATAELGSGVNRGPLHGIPIAIKDNYLTADMPTTAGTQAAGYHFGLRDAVAVQRLRNAGAIILGKTHLHEFAWGTVTPPTRNPWDTQRIPGGSSGGSAAAVAACFCPAALGSDTGGSIRIPAGLCGIVGIKPTYGLISRSGIVPHSWSLDHAGPLTRNVADAALLLQILAGYDADDRGSARTPIPDYSKKLDQPISGMKIGVCRNHFFERNTPAVNQAVELAIADLSAQGTEIIELTIDHLEYGLAAIYAIELASSSAWHDRALQNDETYAMQPDVRTLIEMGRMVSGADLVRAEQLRTLLMTHFQQAFERVDIILTPTLPLTAWDQDENQIMINGQPENPLAASWRLTYPFNLTGLPAISVPCGFDERQLPIGLQLIAQPFDEARLLQVANAYEKIHQWGRFQPDSFM